MDRLPCKSLLTAFCTLIVHHAVVFLLLTRFSGGESQETGQPQPIVAMVGDDITLPCHVKPGSGAGVGMLEWSRPDLNPRFVHVWRSGGDHLVDQNPSYRGRTSVSIDKLKQGDTSLKLSKVKLTDEGTYRCFIPRLITDYSVQLIVGAVINMSTVSSGELECKSKGWYPEPEVLWLDGEGKLLPAGPTETVRGPDDLYTVSSRVTVEKRHSNSFTCRVQQKDINQTRETHIQVPDDFFKDPSKPSASTIIGLFAGLMIILALVYVVCRWRQNKLKKNHEEEEPQRVREKTRDPVNNSSEQEFLVKTETGREENDEEENNERFLSEEGGRPCESEEETHQSQQNVNRRNLEETPEATTTATEGQGSTEPEGQEDETQAGRDTKPEEETNRTKPLPQTETKPEQPTEEGLEKSQGPEDGGGPTGGTEDGEMSGDGHAEELAERERVTDRGSSVDPIVAEETKNLDNELEENNTRSLSEEGGRPCQREEETHQSQQNVNRGNLEIPEAATTATEGQSSTEPEGQEDETQAGRDTR